MVFSPDRRMAERPCSMCHGVPCHCSREQKRSRDALVYYQLNPERSFIINGSQEALEMKSYSPDHPERKIYGTLPYFGRRDMIVGRFDQEARYFSRHYDPRNDPSMRGSQYAEGAIFFGMKFGFSLSKFTESILDQYPDQKKEGRDICVFGLSGAGKSGVLEAMRRELGEKAVIIDNDTARYNLLARMILNCERKSGVSASEVRKNLMHNAISAPLYLTLNHVAAELAARGYDVVRSSVMPSDGADTLVYIEHPDGVDPRTVSDGEIARFARVLYERTHARCPNGDTYDWSDPQTITDFRQMPEVSVDVPEYAHASLLKNLRAALAQKRSVSVVSLKNEYCPDTKERQRRIEEQVRSLLA